MSNDPLRDCQRLQALARDFAQRAEMARGAEREQFLMWSIDYMRRAHVLFRQLEKAARPPERVS
jgi:hypothetical protein